jgi:hypothetical protein
MTWVSLSKVFMCQKKVWAMLKKRGKEKKSLPKSMNKPMQKSMKKKREEKRRKKERKIPYTFN